MRLYTNQDAGNILWEYAFEYLWLEPLYAGMDTNDEVLYVSADDTEVPLEAVLIGYANREDKNPIRLLWSQTGSGSLQDSIQTDDDQGIFDNTLTLPTTAGSRSTVSVKMQGSNDTESTLPPFEVLPGKPSNITVEQVGGVSVNGHGEAEFTYTVRDQHNNLVSDGTGITFNLSEALQIVSSDSETVNGQAKAVIKGGAIAGMASITVQAGITELSNEIEVKPLTITWAGVQTEYNAGQLVNDAVLVTDFEGNPVSGAEVTLTSTYGLIQNANLITDSAGYAQFALTMPGVEGVGNLSASIGFEYTDLGNYDVVYENNVDRPLEAGNAVVIGDQPAAGQLEHTRYDGEVIAVNYDISTTVNVLGNENDQVTVTLGDIHDPNIPALTATGDFYNGIVSDKAGHLDLDAENVSQVHDAAIGAGTSLRFAQNNSLLSADDVSRIDLNNDLGVNLSIKPESGGGTLVDLRSGLFKVGLNNDGTLTASLKTLDGNYTVTSTNAATDSQWHNVSARYHNNQLELWVNNEQFTTAATGDIGRVGAIFTAQKALEIGKGYRGKLHRLKWFDWSASPLLTFASSQTKETFTVDTSGDMPVQVKSTGNLGANNSSVDIQRVAITAGGVRQYVSLMSKDRFAQIAGMYVSTLADDVPPINEAGLVANYQKPSLPLSGIFPQAHAFSVSDFAWGAVNFLVPVEDAKIIFEQFNNLLFGEPGSFEPAEFTIAAINLFTVLTPAKPLKLFTKPAAKFLRAMKTLNPKFLASLGGVFKRVMHQGRNFNFDLLLQSLPFIIIAAEAYADDEARAGLEVLVKSIASEEDMIAWIEYLSMPSDGWEGDEPPIVEPFSAEEEAQASLPLSFLFSQAYAAPGPRLNKTKILKLFKHVGKHAKSSGTKHVSTGVHSLNKALKNSPHASARRVAHEGYFLQMAIAGARRQVTNAFQVMVKGEKYTRLSTPAMIGVMEYLEYESACGRLLDTASDSYDTNEANELGCNGKGFKNPHIRSIIHRKYAEAFADAADRNLKEETDKGVSAEEKDTVLGKNYAGHGAIFHLHELARYQLLARSGAGPEIKDTEAFRVVGFAKNVGRLNDAKGPQGLTSDYLKRFRWVDIVLDTSEGEHWIELKSMKARSASIVTELASSNINPWSIKTHSRNVQDNTGSGLHRQATLDRVAKNQGVAWEKKDNPDDDSFSRNVTVSDFTWVFQKFNRRGERSPTLSNISKKLSTTAKLPDGKAMKFALGNPPANSHYILSGFGQTVDLLRNQGFDIVNEADDIIGGLD